MQTAVSAVPELIVTRQQQQHHLSRRVCECAVGAHADPSCAADERLMQLRVPELAPSCSRAEERLGRRAEGKGDGRRRDLGGGSRFSKLRPRALQALSCLHPGVLSTSR